jgi:hypothetical protein
MTAEGVKKDIGIVGRIKSGWGRIIDALRGWEDGELNSQSFWNKSKEFIDGSEYTLDVVDSPFIIKADLVKARSRGVIVRLAVGSKEHDPVQVAYLKHEGVDVCIVDQTAIDELPLRPMIADRKDQLLISPSKGRFALVRSSLRLADKFVDDFNTLVTPI